MTKNIKNINNNKKYEIVYVLQFKDERGNYKNSKKYIKYFGSDNRKKYVNFVCRLLDLDYEVEHIEVVDATYLYDRQLSIEIEEASE